ncbi:type III-B CRISPR module RAMP protein Cmr6 [Thermococcus waiotapuensis]|uniref:Type III-B CRISPR module RAMP protein Cmr6 n=1 Tax=Thermococcus waiotapuensis TaxID=90909 RepID=A0AAE4NXR8_9EURY|nr:type III-B CRISPR module RAMP protein Cmr6 [Thermococcus waiotapuensis]MDV3104838.1 type III-B CRISPR module RAMP protein Cmr6 [Thermococcus waiotapuensis]
MGFYGGKPQKGRHWGGGNNQNNPHKRGKGPEKYRNNPGKSHHEQNNRDKSGKKVKYIVPAETLKAFKGVDPWKGIDNLSLKLEKFAPYEWKEVPTNGNSQGKIANNDAGGDDDKGVPTKVSGSVLKEWVGEKGLEIGEEALQAYKKFFNLYKEMAETLAKNNVFRLKTASRLVVGLGDESVYETSIRLLRNYGVPYIPGTALKGIARAYALEKFADENFDTLKDKLNKDNFYEIVGELERVLSSGKLKLDSEENSETQLQATFGENSKVRVPFEELVEIFGTTKKSGEVIFFDALPVPSDSLKAPLEFDIMNPHYGPYYQEDEAPGDWHDPVPVIYLTVKPGVEFLFAVAPLGRGELAEKAKAILEEALKEHGVGAKTSLGYGCFK